jgi:hypothetical protein
VEVPVTGACSPAAADTNERSKRVGLELYEVAWASPHEHPQLLQRRDGLQLHQ